MMTLSGETAVIPFQNLPTLLNISILVPTTFIPVLLLYELGGDFFDFPTVTIPILHVKFGTLRNNPRHLYTRVGVTGFRLRSLVCAFGLVEDENLPCFGTTCTLPQRLNATKKLSDTKIPFGPQFTILYRRPASHIQMKEKPSFEKHGFKVLRSHTMWNTDKYLYIVNVSATDANRPSHFVQLFCLACDENWRVFYGYAARGIKSHDFNYRAGNSSSFWNQLQQATYVTTSNGVKFQWSYGSGYTEHARSSLRLLCDAYQKFLNQPAYLRSFSSVKYQLEFTVFPVKNTSALIDACSQASTEYVSKDDNAGWRFYVEFSNSQVGLELIDWKSPESFDEAFMFITDQNVTSKRYAADLYLKAFDIGSWIGILFTGSLTCFALAKLLENSMFLSSMWTSARYLGAFFLDQCPSTLPFNDSAAVRSKKALLFLVVPWMMAILILSNGFRGVMKSNYVANFPFETNLKSWSHFKEFDLFTFVRDEDCKYTTKVWNNINEAWIRYVAHGRQKKDWCYKEDPKTHAFMPLLMELETTEFRENRIDEWVLQAQKHIMEELQAVETSFYKRFIQRYYEEGFALLCVRNFSSFSGLAYQGNVDKWNKVARNSLIGWNLTYEYLYSMYHPCKHAGEKSWFRDGLARGENVIKAFWMTRRHESAYVIRKSEFPWYWNLFKKAMANDSRVQFAHTGGAEVKRRTKSAIYERNDSPFYLLVRHRYMEPANWMIRRVYAIQESGIFNLWYKWDMILRPPVNESLNEEVSETSDEVRELRLDDPGILFLVTVAAVLMLISGVVFGVEVLSVFV